ncbi:MAG: NAD(P)-dependent oxidoreductase [Chlorobiales bacterium]|nr:NAD(P)-dependent oxidoreductase [Chlorobiales bacterium]
MKDRLIKIGIVGTGFISKGFNIFLETQSGFVASKVLTRRKIETCTEFPRRELLTNSLQELIDHSDVIVECSGDPLHAAVVTEAAFDASLPVVTLNSEFHITCGTYFLDKGLLTESEGDQPGCLAALTENAVSMGFKPLVFGNVKGYHNLEPTPEDMRYWSQKQGISLQMVTAATDGSKLQVEQTLVANGLDADIACEGLLGFPSGDLNVEALRLAEAAKQKGKAITDYIILPGSRTRVFLVAEHDPRQKESLDYLKFGSGPYYVLTQNTMLCHLEVLKTVKRVLTQKTPLLNNSKSPRISVAAVAKRDLLPGEQITHGCGSFEVRGIAVKIADHPNHVPIGLLSSVVITNPVEKGEILCFDHVEVPPSLALKAWQHTKELVLSSVSIPK